MRRGTKRRISKNFKLILAGGAVTSALAIAAGLIAGFFWLFLRHPVIIGAFVGVTVGITGVFWMAGWLLERKGMLVLK